MAFIFCSPDKDSNNNIETPQWGVSRWVGSHRLLAICPKDKLQGVRSRSSLPTNPNIVKSCHPSEWQLLF
jgi:hypothetical protein